MRYRRTWKDDLDLRAKIITQSVSRRCTKIENFEFRKFQEYLIEELERVVRDFNGKLKDTD